MRRTLLLRTRSTQASSSDARYAATTVSGPSSGPDTNYTATVAPSHASTQASNPASTPAAAPTRDYVSGEQYRHALTDLAIAQRKVKELSYQLEEREQRIAGLQKHIALERLSSSSSNLFVAGGSSVDDFSIKNAASQLERMIKLWASEILRVAPVPPATLKDAALSDVASAWDTGLFTEARPMLVQSLLRHAMAEAISEGFINCLIVTSLADANKELTRTHERLFARDPTVAAVWRRGMLTVAVEDVLVAPETTRSVFEEHLPSLSVLLQDQPDDPLGTRKVLEYAYRFSRMLHGAPAADTFYRSFIPEIGCTLDARQVEAVKRCCRSDRGEVDRVGVTIFPGLVKVSRNLIGPGVANTVVRRAQVICECALQATSYPGLPSPTTRTAM